MFPTPPYGHAQDPSSYGHAQGPSLYGHAQGPSSYGDAPGPSLYSHAQGPSSYGDAPGPSLYGNAQGPSSYGARQGPSLDTDDGYDFFDHFRDAPLDSGPSFDEYPDSGPSDYAEGAAEEGIAPVPRWIEDTFDGGTSVVDRGDGLIPAASDLTLIRQGEISASEVVHTAGPTRTTITRTVRRANLPATPYSAPRTLADTTEEHEAPIDAEHEASSPSQPKVIRLTTDVIAQTIQAAKELVTRVIFSKHAMVYSGAQRKSIIDKVIEDSVPQFFKPNVVFQAFITNSHRRRVGNALSSKRGRIIDFARSGVCQAFDLFPPRGHPLPPKHYRVARIDWFINGHDPLMFMHAVSFDEHNNMIVLAKFQNSFILGNAIRFIWYWGCASFLGESPLKTIKYIVAVSGAATYCSLKEQGQDTLEVDAFGGKIFDKKFKDILHAFSALTPAEKLEFDQYLSYMLVIGPSQARQGIVESPSTSDANDST
ncbi:hypothetical protein EDB19DRAFT_2041743 [Suillus lakei]|nr:hypothetical protein EDB19DRAFT_2041743 [Suillus lakei]